MRYLDYFEKLISHTQRRKSKDRNENLLFLRRAIDEKQGLPLTQRPGYKETKNVLIDMQKNSRKDLGVQFIQKSERKREHDKIDPSLQGHLEGLSIIGLSTSQKNVNSQPHLPLLTGLQHPGGAHSRGLRIGKNGINTVGRMINGQNIGESLTCAQENIRFDWHQETGCSIDLKKNTSTRPKSSDCLPNSIFSTVSRPVRRHSLNATGCVHSIHFLSARTAHFSS